MVLNPSPSKLSEEVRNRLIVSLNSNLLDGIDFYSQIKSAHWNVKGNNFMPLHKLFDELAEAVEDYNDDIAERSVILGGTAVGTVRRAAKFSGLDENFKIVPTNSGKVYVEALVDGLETYLIGLRRTRKQAEAFDDQDTFELLTNVIMASEKYGWFLKATLQD